MTSRYQQEEQGAGITKQKKNVFLSAAAAAQGRFLCEAGWHCSRGERWRAVARELFTRISGTSIHPGEPMATGQRRGVRHTQKMILGWNELVGKSDMVRHIFLFADGHTASNAPDLM